MGGRKNKKNQPISSPFITAFSLIRAVGAVVLAVAQEGVGEAASAAVAAVVAEPRRLPLAVLLIRQVLTVVFAVAHL